MAYLYLSLSIIFEIVGTINLKASNGFTHFWPSVIVSISYTLCFYFMSLTLKSLSIGFTYAVWSGLGILFIAILGVILFDEKIDIAGMIGIGLILSGVVTLNFFSNMTTH